jgi:hypothetical protein
MVKIVTLTSEAMLFAITGLGCFENCVSFRSEIGRCRSLREGTRGHPVRLLRTSGFGSRVGERPPTS